MKAKYYHQQKTHTSKKFISADDTGFKNDLDRVAGELVELARRQLPDHVLRGVMAGLEDDIRQDAILMALNWYLRPDDDRPDRENLPWFAPRAIAGALKIQKRDYLIARKLEVEAMKSVPKEQAGMVSHPSMMASREWPESALLAMVRRAIRMALQAGRISHANAGIAIRVLVDQVPVSVLAAQRKVHRSAIHQRLGRVRREIPELIEGIELPLKELL